MTPSPKRCLQEAQKRGIGPYFITAEGDNYVYKLRRCDNGQKLRAYVHSNRLRPFNESRDVFHTRDPPSNDAPSSTQQGQALTPNIDTSPASGLDNGWYEIDRVTSRRMIAGKLHFFSMVERWNSSI